MERGSSLPSGLPVETTDLAPTPRVPRHAEPLMEIGGSALPFNPQPKPTRESRLEADRQRKAGGNYGRDWPKYRAAALSRDSYKCVRCGSKVGVEVHHVSHVGFKGRDDSKHALTNLLSLCWRHHAQAEDGTISRPELYALLEKVNAVSRDEQEDAEEWPAGFDSRLSVVNGRA